MQVGDVVFAELKKPRNPRFHRLAHQLGTLVAENIESFHGMNPHKVLKRLQLEGNIGCDEVAFKVPGIGMITQRIPKSLSFESMDELEFKEVMRGMSRHIVEQYWPTSTEKEVEQMAEIMIGD